MQKVNI